MPFTLEPSMDLMSVGQSLSLLLFAVAMCLCRGVYSGMPGFLKPCWAIFFLTGLYIESTWALVGLILLAIIIDIHVESSSKWLKSCLTRGYFWLPLAYAALWLAGRIYHWGASSTLGLFICILIGTLSAEFLTSGGFYIGSGYFERPNLKEFLRREVRFYPGYAITVIIYVFAAVSVYSLVAPSR